MRDVKTNYFKIYPKIIVFKHNQLKNERKILCFGSICDFNNLKVEEETKKLLNQGIC